MRSWTRMHHTTLILPTRDRRTLMLIFAITIRALSWAFKVPRAACKAEEVMDLILRIALLWTMLLSMPTSRVWCILMVPWSSLCALHLVARSVLSTIRSPSIKAWPTISRSRDHKGRFQVVPSQSSTVTINLLPSLINQRSRKRHSIIKRIKVWIRIQELVYRITKYFTWAIQNHLLKAVSRKEIEKRYLKWWNP